MRRCRSIAGTQGSSDGRGCFHGAAVYVYLAAGIPRSVPVIYVLLLILLLSGPRMIYRWLKDHHMHISPDSGALLSARKSWRDVGSGYLAQSTQELSTDRICG